MPHPTVTFSLKFRFQAGLACILLMAPLTARAAQFPGASIDNSHGLRNAVFMVIRGTSQPDVPVSAQRIADIQASEDRTRQFYAANSGGAFDLEYTSIVDVVVETQAVVENGQTLHRRVSNNVGDTWAQARQYVRDHYPQANIDSAYLKYYDVSGTSPDAGQGWSGIAWGDNVANQEDINSNWGQIVSDHEIGHRVGFPHAQALRSFNDSNYTPYVWDLQDDRYEVYDPAEHGYHVTTYGINRDEYGDPFDTMGNISHGQFSVHSKLTRAHWLTNNQVPDLNAMGAGDYRIYAHDELVPVYGAYTLPNGNPAEGWGVEQTYAADKLYGLTYQRPGERFNTSTRAFETYNQTITLEYRSGQDGLQFHLEDYLLDVDPEHSGSDRNSRERELEVGRSIEDIDFATSVYLSSGDMDNFLSYNPPRPDQPWQYMSDWFEFEVTGLGSDGVGSYVDVSVSIVDLIEPGDFDNSGALNNADINLFRGFWHSDTSAMTTAEKFRHGDMDFSGLVDLNDLWLLSDVFADHGVAFSFSLQVPEPGTLGLVVMAGTLAVGWRTGRRTSRRRPAATWA